MKQLYFICSFFTLLSAQTFEAVIQRLEQTPIPQRQRLIEQYLNTKRTSPIIEQDTLLHFVLYGTADSVFVTGNLQNWREPELLERLECGQYSLFYKSFVVPSDARLDYQLIIDGKYKTDPQNPLITPSGFGPHSEVRMPKFVSSPYLLPRNDIPHGMIDSLAPVQKIPPPLNRYLISPRPIKVYTPPGYDTLSGLPSIYVHDGFEAIDYSLFPIIIDNLIAENKIPPIIAVFIPPVDRGEEHMGGKRERFVKYVCDELVPLIDHLYRTDPSPGKRAVTGISSAGFLSLYTALNRPDVFLNVGGQSPTITSLLIDVTKARFAAGKISPHVKMYIDCGQYDIADGYELNGQRRFIDQNRSYSNLLSSLRIPHYFKEVNDGHEWASWRERTPEMLIYFFGKQ